jgi:hypothetical protein
MKKQRESQKFWALSWVCPLAVVALLIWMPQLSMPIAFVCALLFVFFPGASNADPDNLSFAFNAICLGLAIFCAVVLFWFFFGNRNEVALNDILFPHKEMPFDLRLSLFGWAAVFAGLIHGARFIFRAHLAGKK